MEAVSQALRDVKSLYQKVVGEEVPELTPVTYCAFPPCANPVDFAVQEARHLKELSDQLESTPAPATWLPPADVFTTEATTVIRLEIPGVARDDVKVLLADGQCIIEGERKAPEAKLRPFALERPWGKFQRSFAMPAINIEGKVTARYQDGVLEVRIPSPKREIRKQSTIKVE